MTYEVPLVQVACRGIYGKKTAEPDAEWPALPGRMARLRPEAAEVFARVQRAVPSLVLSDMYRTPLESLTARAAKTGVAMPGFSGHNFGVSIDVALDATLGGGAGAGGGGSGGGAGGGGGGGGGLTWSEFVHAMIEAGATPYDANGYRASAEAWHWNLLDLPSRVPAHAWGTRGHDVEAWIRATYGEALYLPEGDWKGAQTALARLGLYPSAPELLDGVPGRRTAAAVEVLRRLLKSGKLRGHGLTLSSAERRVLAAVLARVTVDGKLLP